VWILTYIKKLQGFADTMWMSLNGVAVCVSSLILRSCTHAAHVGLSNSAKPNYEKDSSYDHFLADLAAIFSLM